MLEYGTNDKNSNNALFATKAMTVLFLRVKRLACGTRNVKTHAECACVAPPAQLAPCGLCGGTSLRPKAIPRDVHGARPVALELLAKSTMLSLSA